MKGLDQKIQLQFCGYELIISRTKELVLAIIPIMEVRRKAILKILLTVSEHTNRERISSHALQEW